MMLQNTQHSNGYQPVRQYICLQAQCKVPKPSIGQAENIKYFNIFLLYTYPSLKMALVHNTSHVFTYTVYNCQHHLLCLHICNCKEHFRISNLINTHVS
jgi:hypothetical protein